MGGAARVKVLYISFRDGYEVSPLLERNIYIFFFFFLLKMITYDNLFEYFP